MTDKSLTRRIIILGSTGSIGTQALDVIAHVNDLAKAGKSPIKFEVVGLAAKNNAALLAEQARRFNVKHVALCSVEKTLDTNSLPPQCKCVFGSHAAEQLVRLVESDLVLVALVGSAGIAATLAALDCKRPIALANKESLVAAGDLVTAACRRHDKHTRIFPVDSEHAALGQIFEGRTRAWEVGDRTLPLNHHIEHSVGLVPPTSFPIPTRAILTASGGPFRTWKKDQIEAATPEQAQNHPTWNMGAKVTIDCASLMNKALELIEAHWLFGLPAKKLDVLIHPQSIVHAIAEFADGSSIAQLASPDMKLPIQRAICWPLMLDGASRRMSWSQMKSLEFETPDLTRFPALGLAYKVLELGGTAGATFNAANEEAVAAFLARKVTFGAIPRVVEAAIDDCKHGPINSLDDVKHAESAAREFVKERIAKGRAK